MAVPVVADTAVPAPLDLPWTDLDRLWCPLAAGLHTAAASWDRRRAEGACSACNSRLPDRIDVAVARDLQDNDGIVAVRGTDEDMRGQ